MRTLLGSCVGIAFRVPRLGVAALCHRPCCHCIRRQNSPADRDPICCRAPLRRLCDSRSGQAIRRVGREPKRSRGQAVRGRRCAGDGQQCEKAHGGLDEQRSGHEGARGGRLRCHGVFVGRQTRREHSLQHFDWGSAAATALMNRTSQISLSNFQAIWQGVYLTQEEASRPRL